MENNIEDNFLKNEENTIPNVQEQFELVEGNVIIDLDDLQEKDNNQKSGDERGVYSVPIVAKNSVDYIAMQNRLNQLLKKKKLSSAPYFVFY